MTYRLIRYSSPGGHVRFARVEDGLARPTDGSEPIRIADAETFELEPPFTLLTPVQPPEVWCAGVTYAQSRDARIEESAVKDVYSRVYAASRPELFLKDAGGRRTVGPGAAIGIRSDSGWDVPEPEIALVLGDTGRISGFTIGNDVSSRAIEGENPLYLPQAKIFAGACALGPAILVADDWHEPFEIRLRIISSDGGVTFESSTSTQRMSRSFAELVEWLLRDNPVPPGSVLLTGTGIVPPGDVTLGVGDMVEIRVAEIGTLKNVVAPAKDVSPPDDSG